MLTGSWPCHGPFENEEEFMSFSLVQHLAMDSDPL